MQFQTLVEAEVPRVSCSEHGVVQVRVLWAEAVSRFTAIFELYAPDLPHMVFSRSVAWLCSNIKEDRMAEQDRMYALIAMWQRSRASDAAA